MMNWILPVSLNCFKYMILLYKLKQIQLTGCAAPLANSPQTLLCDDAPRCGPSHRALAVAAGLTSSFLAGACANADTANTVARIAIADFILKFPLVM
jgi:hypothetical protein